MRTTLNLDDDVVARLNHEASRGGRSLSRVANDLIRAGILADEQKRAAAAVTPYIPPVVDTGRPLMDVTDIAEVLDLIADA
ncbi:MAG: antitoxin [Actinobacteria bacterium]|nr:antitoxin [Actinomycetota bacterium]